RTRALAGRPLARAARGSGAVEGVHIDRHATHPISTGLGLDVPGADPAPDPLLPDVLDREAFMPDGLPTGASRLPGRDQVAGPGPGDLEGVPGEHDHVAAPPAGVGDVPAENRPARLAARRPPQPEVHAGVIGRR